MFNDYAQVQVPPEKGVSGWHIGLIYIGIGLALPAFLLGSRVGASLGLTQGMLAIVASGVILTLVGGVTGAIGARVRLSTYMITQITFGRMGANVINLLIAATIAGWFGIIIHMFARSLDTLLIEQFSLHFGIVPWGLVGGALMTSTAVWGFKGLDKLSLLVVGKREVRASPSPLPQGGQFPPFTDVPVSGIGRLRPEYPLRGVICFDLRRLMIEVGQAQ